MVYKCLTCNNEKTFKDDEKAEKEGYFVIGYNVAESSRYVRCPACRDLILAAKDRRSKIVGPKASKDYYVIPPRIPSKMEEIRVSKNALRFEMNP